MSFVKRELIHCPFLRGSFRRVSTVLVFSSISDHRISGREEVKSRAEDLDPSESLGTGCHHVHVALQKLLLFYQLYTRSQPQSCYHKK